MKRKPSSLLFQKVVQLKYKYLLVSKLKLIDKNMDLSLLFFFYLPSSINLLTFYLLVLDLPLLYSQTLAFSRDAKFEDLKA